MRCQFCRKQIGWLRRLRDREFCSADHRQRARMLQSARQVRDVVDLYGDETWAGARRVRQRPSISPGAGLLTVALCVALMLLLPGESQQPMPPQSYLPPSGALGDRIFRALPGKPSVSMREDFQRGLRNWMALDGSSRDGWTYGGGWMKPGSLRLWKPTLQLSDYQFEFEGQIEKKAMNWAFRATDQGNFYGAKLAVGGSASQRAELVRTIRVAGHEHRRTRLPIPLNIREGVTYLVKVRVKGDRFHTIVAGQLVDSWTDHSLRAGGVGFYVEPGERSAVRWVSISDQEGFFQRFLTLSFLIGPRELMGPLPPLY
jgi:hypothetical protein